MSNKYSVRLAVTGVIGLLTVGLALQQAGGRLGQANTTGSTNGNVANDPVVSDTTFEGFGRNTVGGKGGTLYTVTNLNDSGPCSLRQFAQNTSGPRIIRFAVSGTIQLRVPLVINSPFVTIDGSTAPNQGITIRGGGLTVRAWEVIVRYLRIRPGLEVSNPGSSNAIHILQPDPGIYPSTARTYNVVVDHCSLTWSTDQNMGIDGQNVTVQWSIISELMEGSGAVLLYYRSPTATFHHNLLSNNPGARNPEVGDGDVDWVNNVIYRNFDGHNFYGPGQDLKFSNFAAIDPGCSLEAGSPSYCNGPGGFPEGGPVRVNYVGNLFKPGLVEVIGLAANYKQVVLLGARRFAPQSSIYFEGNIGPARPNDSLPQTDIAEQGDAGTGKGYLFPVASTRHPFPQVTTTSAAQAYDDVLAKVGPRLPCLDPVDRRILKDVMNRTGRIITNPNQVGGYSDLTQPCDPTPLTLRE